MKGGRAKMILFYLTVLLLIDLYAFRGIYLISQTLPLWSKWILYSLYWLVLAYIALMAWVIAKNMGQYPVGKLYYRSFYSMMGVMILFYVPKLLFLIFMLSHDLLLAGKWIANLFQTSKEVIGNGQAISRADFILKAGIIAAGIPFISIANGIARGKYSYRVNNLPISSSKLPEAFKGFKIAHISDWHIGSFYGRRDQVQRAVELINEQNPDLILFTGDMVNNVAEEMTEFLDILAQLKAKQGVYAVLGNHDYGEYIEWNSESEKKANLALLESHMKEAGFNLLKNESVAIYRDVEQIFLVGVENWGVPPFPQYGDLSVAMEGVPKDSFKILMSHDPSHWDAKVLNNTDIDLTLSGHTHGMQFGIDIPGFKWSPVKWKYPRWSGLYQERKQKLHINVGLGYIGFPGRVGINPEISMIELT